MRRIIFSALLLSASVPAAAASYTGHFNVLVTNGGRFDTTYDGLGDPIYNYTSYVGRFMTLDWSSSTSFNVRSPVFPYEFRPVFTVNSAKVNEVSLQGLFTAPFDGNFSSFATFNGDEEAASLRVAYSGNSTVVQDIAFTYSNGSGLASGSGRAEIQEYFNSFGVSFEFDIVGGRAFAAVPEPLTWGLMLVGFGACGATLRRQRMSQRTAQCERVSQA